jgi:DNA-binding MurR/RpiR family transcriptional regulator
MTSYKKLKERIQFHYGKLPKNQKKIAEFFLENFDHISFLTVQKVAEATSTNVAAVVRFAQSIGFSGFSEMRDEIVATLQNRLQSNNVFPSISSSKLVHDTLTTVANQDIANISDTLNLNERENYSKVIDLIINSERVFTVGLGISHLLAEIITYQLNQVGIFSNVLTNNQSTFMEQILFMNKKDLIITLSFPPYSKTTIEAVKYAHEKKIKIVSLTNKKSSPISFFSDVSLIIRSENLLFTNSFAAISVLINAIVTECALKNKSKATKWLSELKNITKIQDNTVD